jgi:excisionase family DNA binding protein
MAESTYTVAEVAGLHRVSRYAVRKLIEDLRLRAVRLGAVGGRIVIPHDAVWELLTGRPAPDRRRYEKCNERPSQPDSSHIFPYGIPARRGRNRTLIDSLQTRQVQTA